jgi:hypothetical protein
MYYSKFFFIILIVFKQEEGDGSPQGLTEKVISGRLALI